MKIVLTMTLMIVVVLVVVTAMVEAAAKWSLLSRPLPSLRCRSRPA